MSHQGITAGAHHDGVYHDSHALQGGAVGLIDTESLTFDSYSDYLFVRKANLVTPVYDLNTGAFQFNNPRWPDYANFAGNKYVFVQNLGVTTSSYIQFDIYDYSGGASVATFRTDTGFTTQYAYNAKVYTISDSRNMQYYFFQSKIFIHTLYVNVSPVNQGGTTSIKVKHEVAFTDVGFSAAGGSVLLKAYNEVYYHFRGLNVSNGFVSVQYQSTTTSSMLTRLYDNYVKFYERVWVSSNGYLQYPASKNVAYSSNSAFGVARLYSVNLVNGVVTTLSSLPFPGTYLDNMLGFYFSSGNAGGAGYAFRYASDSDLTYPTIERRLQSTDEAYSFRALINGVWITYTAGVNVGKVYFEKKGWNYAIHKTGTTQKVKRLKNDMTTLEDFITL